MLLVINLFGGPSNGKSTLSWDIAADLSRYGVRVQIVGEEAKDLILKSADLQLENQFMLAAMQYNRLLNIRRAGYTVAIADSPLLMNLAYATEHHYERELTELTHKVNTEFDNINLYIQRAHSFDPTGRQQTEVEADFKDSQIYQMFKSVIHREYLSTEYEAVKNYVRGVVAAKGLLN